MKLHSSFKVATLVVSVLITVTFVVNATPRKADQWTKFSNPALGYSFRYPKYLHLVRRPLAEMNIEGLIDAIDLKADSESSSVFRVLVVDTRASRSARASDSVFLRQVCKSYQEFQIDGRLAINCVTCGSAACAWTVHVPGSREFRLLSLLADANEKPGPEDGLFPIRSIIKSFRWTGANTEKP